jgi:hypothetical protein
MEVNNGLVICPFPHVSSWYGAELIKPRIKFTLTFDVCSGE